MSAILEVESLTTTFATDRGVAEAINDVSFSLQPGSTLGIVGESGCGKTVTSLAILRLLPRPSGQITGGRILYRDMDLVTASLEQMYDIRGNRISMIFQEPMTALNPVHKIGHQIAESFRLHHTEMTAADVHTATIDIMQKVGIPNAKQRFDMYPHQLSGGMRQRAMIALALACKPDILIADEPTTALDVTIQAQILKLMKDLQKETGMSIVFITHDLGVIADMCDEVVVMYAGRVVEQAGVHELFASPRHPYTQGLLRSVPRLESAWKEPLPTIEGMVPGLFDMPEGCRFENRCPYANDKCREEAPTLESCAAGRNVRCHHWRKL